MPMRRFKEEMFAVKILLPRGASFPVVVVVVVVGSTTDYTRFTRHSGDQNWLPVLNDPVSCGTRQSPITPPPRFLFCCFHTTLAHLSRHGPGKGAFRRREACFPHRWGLPSVPARSGGIYSALLPSLPSLPLSSPLVSSFSLSLLPFLCLPVFLK